MKNIAKQKLGANTILAAWQSQLQQTDEKPWLTTIMCEHQAPLFKRFSHFYGQIRALPRRHRRRLKRKLQVTLAGAALLLAMSRYSAQANSITVIDGEVALDNNGLCSLVEAIENANDTISGQPHPDCAVGNPAGADIINLPVNGYFRLTAVYGTDSGLPDINSQVTIEGNGTTIQRDSSAPPFIIMSVTDIGDLTLNKTTISGGESSWWGGGIRNSGTLTINESTISGNTGAFGGGVANGVGFSCPATPVLNINNSTISGNTAVMGGGIFHFNFSCDDEAMVLTINNSTISGNTADVGGGIDQYGYGFGIDAPLIINHSTITGNSAASYAGGVHVNSPATFNRSMISGNSAPTNSEVGVGWGSVTANNNNLFGHSSNSGVNFAPGPNDIVPAEPLSDILNTTLLNNGGPTATHALIPDSPAIDAGPIDADCLSTDQRGITRPQGAACDIGAFEFVSVGTLRDDVQELVDNKSITSWQGRALFRLLNQAQRSIQREQLGKAIMNLNNFIHTINRFIDTGTLTHDQGRPLIDSAQALIDSLTP